MGHLDSKGHIEIRGRADRVIITGGELIHPETVEEAARATDMITAAQCRGVEDPEWGQRVELAVVPRYDDFSEKRLSSCLSQKLPPFAIPKRIHRVDTLDGNAFPKLAGPEE